jgi:hypothetical protein
MYFMKHHSASAASLILHQLARQDQLQGDTRNKKMQLWRSAAKCLLGGNAGGKHPSKFDYN